MATDLQIWNQALQRIRGQPVTSTNPAVDTSRQALLLSIEYPTAKELALLAAPWTFASERTQLTVDPLAPPKPWTGLYVLPPAVVAEARRTIGIQTLVLASDGCTPVEYEVAFDRTAGADQKWLYADTRDALLLTSTVDIGEGPMPFYFTDYLAWELAARIAQPLTASGDLIGFAAAKAAEAFDKALRIDRQQRSAKLRVRVRPAYRQLNARGGGPAVEGEGPD